MDSTPVDNTGRFSGRVDAYVRHRQGYPPEAIKMVTEHFGFPPDGTIADLGSGTGILSRQLLNQLPHAQIIGVEPNEEMRSEGEKQLSSHSHFRSVGGTAEATTLPDHSVDLVTAAAAFHWFDGPSARKEILRITKPAAQGHPMAIFTRGRVNPDRHDIDQYWLDFTDKMREFQRQAGVDYTEKVHRAVLSDESLNAFFGHGEWKKVQYPGHRELTWEQILGGLESYSSNPKDGTEESETLIRKMKEQFDKFQKDGKVIIARDHVVYLGYVR